MLVGAFDVKVRRDFKIDLRVRGILNSKKMFLGDPSINLTSWRKDLELKGTPSDLTAFVKHVNADHLPHAVIVEATATEAFLPSYTSWFDQGLHLITPNKKANSASLKFYRQLLTQARNKQRHYFYSTTVGAGLPILTTLRDLIQTGDRRENKFSQVVGEAREKGFTEPDPREDLSGQDVGRKLVILAREMGLPTEMSDIEIENLVPEADRKGSVEEWLIKLPKNDAVMEARRAEAEKRGEVLRYVGVIAPPSKISVQLKSYAKDHPFAGLSQSDNMILFKTERYSKQPLIIRGPGAGPQVTAAGVFADLLRLTSLLGGTP